MYFLGPKMTSQYLLYDLQDCTTVYDLLTVR